jgi:hypothetical protein
MLRLEQPGGGQFDVTIAGGAAGVAVSGVAQLAMKGGAIHDLGPSCGAGVSIARTEKAAHLSLDGVDVHDNFGAMTLLDASTALVAHGTFANNGAGNCGAVDTFELFGASTLYLQSPAITQTRGVAILGHESGSVTIEGGSLDATRSAIWLDGAAQASLDGVKVTGAASPESGVDAAQGSVFQARDTTLQGFATAR